MKHQRLRRKEEIKEFFDKMSKEEFVRSLEETEFDYYKNIKDPLFRVPRDSTAAWSRSNVAINAVVPCLLSDWRAAPVWGRAPENWTKLGDEEVNDMDYDMAA